jgi:two-component system, NtrC family, response regulator AtoC
MNILLVEDDKNFGRVLAGELREAGYIVDLAGDGFEGVLQFIGRKPDFVVLDIKMPKLDGINALRIMKKIASEVPAITYSGNAGSGEMAESVRAGALRCLTKPFEIGQLRAEIQRYEARHGKAEQG